jgi:hypothetical protein
MLDALFVTADSIRIGIEASDGIARRAIATYA